MTASTFARGDINADELQRRLASTAALRVVDVRTAAEFETAHTLRDGVRAGEAALQPGARAGRRPPGGRARRCVAGRVRLVLIRRWGERKALMARRRSDGARPEWGSGRVE